MSYHFRCICISNSHPNRRIYRYYIVLIDVTSIKESNTSKIPSFGCWITLSYACLIASDIIILLGISRRLVIVIGKLINHSNIVFCCNPRNHVDMMVILPIRECKVCVLWHVNIIPYMRPTFRIFEGINFDVKFAEKYALIEVGFVACLNWGGAYR